MKTISVGDLHGLDYWNQIDPNLYDKIIFLGDYVDSFYIRDKEIMDNLLNVIQFKRDYADKVVLLWGNHDIQYLFNFALYGCSGYRPQMDKALHEVFNSNKDLFVAAYEFNNTIWTHAGVHQSWYDQRFSSYVDKYPELKLSEQIQLAFNEEWHSLFDIGDIRGGFNRQGGPFWCDKSELNRSPLKTMHQIVGHNAKDEISKIYKHNKEIVYVDCLQKKIEFHEKTFKE